jgi:outer membrane receptor protein involved in Fe transport
MTKSVCVWFAILLGSAAPACAQITGSLYGTVKDQAGAVIPKAQITATSIERGNVRTAASGETGEWVLTEVPLGTYNIKIETPGFKAFDRSGVKVAAGDNVRVDAVLQVGATSEAITVTADVAAVESRSSALSATVTEEQLLDLPMNGRNIFDLATLVPGVTDVNAPETFTNDRQGPTFSTSGSRIAENQMQFDGALFVAVFRNTGLNYPPPDAISEVRVRTSNFTAEYGRNAGTVMNVVTKSGTNVVHGSLWEYVRNNNFNARTFFAKSVNKLVKNQYGGTLGGPVIKNKLFLFGSYEGLKIRGTALASSAKPLTSKESSGIFSGKVTDPLTGQLFPNATIPASRFDPTALKVSSLIAPANSANGTLVATYFAPKDNDQGLVRADYYAGKHAIDARYNEVYSRDKKSSGNVPSYEYIGDDTWYHTASIGDTLPISPSLLNVARLAYNRFGGTVAVLTPYSLHSLGSSLPEFGPPNPSEINVSSRFDIGNTSAAPALLVNQTIQLSDSISWIKGAHTFKGGFEFLNLQYLNRTWFQSQGGFTFSGIFTGNSAADFLLGIPQSLSISNPQLEQGGIQNAYSGYFQDDWRVRPRLTLNIGLRYELPEPWYQPNNYWGTFSPGAQSRIYPNAPAGLLFPNDPGVPRGLAPTDKTNFAPRVGFAWDAFGDGKTAVRGGFGIFYNAITSNIIQNGTQPFRYSYTINAPYSLTDPLRGVAPIPAGLNLSNPTFTTNPPPQLTYPNPDSATPYTMQYNLAVQREIVKRLVIEAAYVGKLGRKLLMDIGTNPALYAPGATVANENARRVYPGFGTLNSMSTIANSAYNALQVVVNKRYSSHFMVQGSYTFGKSRDDSSSYVTDTAAVPNPFNLRNEWALSDFYAKHIVSASAIWQMPSLMHSSTILRETVGGWNLSARFTARSGLPINVVTGQDNSLSGGPQQRPNVNGSPVLPSDRSLYNKVTTWFNPAVYSYPAPGTFGDAGRNSIIGPGQYSPNVALLKNFPFWREGRYVQFRAEAFSLFNHPIFSAPQNTLGSTAGKITGASGDRELQFALKLVF